MSEEIFQNAYKNKESKKSKDTDNRIRKTNTYLIEDSEKREIISKRQCDDILQVRMFQTLLKIYAQLENKKIPNH